MKVRCILLCVFFAANVLAAQNNFTQFDEATFDRAFDPTSESFDPKEVGRYFNKCVHNDILYQVAYSWLYRQARAGNWYGQYLWVLHAKSARYAMHEHLAWAMLCLVRLKEDLLYWGEILSDKVSSEVLTKLSLVFESRFSSVEVSRSDYGQALALVRGWLDQVGIRRPSPLWGRYAKLSRTRLIFSTPMEIDGPITKVPYLLCVRARTYFFGGWDFRMRLFKAGEFDRATWRLFSTFILPPADSSHIPRVRKSSSHQDARRKLRKVSEDSAL